MNETPPTLIRANIALFKGERGEVLRLLAQYEGERPADDDPHASMVAWLRAQAQPTDDARIALLYDLIRVAPTDDPYAVMAREYLAAEESYAPPPPPRRRWLWAGAATAAALAVVVGGALLLGGGGPQSGEPTAVSSEGTATPTVTLPDRSEPLVVEAYTLRYDAGVFAITAFEDLSARVMTAAGEPVEAVAGARFLALAASFECRRGVCNVPPEAEVVLLTDNDDRIPVRDGLRVAGGPAMEPVALGRATRGWLVFEVPSLSRPAALLLSPGAAEPDTPPLTIDLSALG